MEKSHKYMMKATSNRPMVKVLLLLTVLTIAFWIAAYFPDVILILIFSALSAFLLRPIVLFVEYRFGIRKIFAVIDVFILVLGALFTIGYFFIPIAIERLQVLYESFRNFPFDQKLNDAVIYLMSGNSFINPEIVTQKLHVIVDGGLQGLSDILAYIAGFLVNLIIVPFITFFILAEGDTAAKKLIEKIPNKYFEMTLNVIYKIKDKLVGYLSGWILDSVIVGILNIIIFYIIGVDYALLLGIIAGISNLIPYIGPIFGVIPAILLSLLQYGDFHQVGMILLFSLVGVQLLDNSIIQPLCFSKTVDMHPVTIIIVLIIGNSIMGVAGMLLAIPIATILKESAVETYWGLRNYRITA
jgi:putative permease